MHLFNKQVKYEHYKTIIIVILKDNSIPNYKPSIKSFDIIQKLLKTFHILIIKINIL